MQAKLIRFRLVLFALFCVITTSLFAQKSVTGTVTNAANAPIAGASATMPTRC